LIDGSLKIVGKVNDGSMKNFGEDKDMAKERSVGEKREGKEGERSFEEIMQDCVERAFIQTFGDIGTRILFYYLWKSFSKDVMKPKKFTDVLHEFLGNGAISIEKAIIRQLYGELGMEFRDADDFDFVRCVEEARRGYEEGRKRKEKKS
jgi:hypothetical protein